MSPRDVLCGTYAVGAGDDGAGDDGAEDNGAGDDGAGDDGAGDDAVNDEVLDTLAQWGVGALGEKMGIELISADRERVVATMPVEGNTQPFGLLHGGASAVLAESLGS
ncbi:MAG: hypothetical protein VXX04_04385, partial [Actinomycetota bacterium]|nr:hypothetical protein [Actinomycetota bacterium]